MASIINSSQTLTMGALVYLINATTGNLTITISAITNDYEFYNLCRTDNSSNTVTINFTTNTVISGESSINLAAFSNVNILSLNSSWYLISGYSKDR